jgi:putative YphP/YqiW family bacilliredoxin
MTYSELMVAPMRRELTDLGFEELRTPAAVDAFLETSQDGTAMLVVNSICGCAAGSLRPAIALALSHRNRPSALGTVFAGQDIEATERARSRFAGYSPSSPAAALFRDGNLVAMLERHQIQGRPPGMIAEDLIGLFERLCDQDATV